MTRTKKLLLAALAGALFSGVAVSAEFVELDEDYSPEPIPVVSQAWDGQMLAEHEAPEATSTIGAEWDGQILADDEYPETGVVEAEEMVTLVE